MEMEWKNVRKVLGTESGTWGLFQRDLFIFLPLPQVQFSPGSSALLFNV